MTSDNGARTDVVAVARAEPSTDDGAGTVVFSDGSNAGTVEADTTAGIIRHGSWEWTAEQALEVGAQWISAATLIQETSPHPPTGGAH